MIYASGAELRDVDKTFNLVVHKGKGPEVGQAGDRTFDQLADVVAALYCRPRFGLEALEAQGNALLVPIHVEDIDVHLLSRSQNIAGLRGAIPRELAEMNQAVSAAQVDEGTEIGEAADRSMPNLTDAKIIQ